MFQKHPYFKYVTIIVILFSLIIAGYVGIRSYQSAQKNLLLQITRPEDKIDKLPALSQTYSDQKNIKKLYDEILALPTSHRNGGCPVAFLTQYSLDFYKDKKVILHAVLKPTGCANVTLNTGEIEDALYPDGQAFIKHVQETLGLTNKEFYGHDLQMGKPLHYPHLKGV